MIFHSFNIQAKILNYLSKSYVGLSIDAICEELKLNLVLTAKVLDVMFKAGKVKKIKVDSITYYGVDDNIISFTLFYYGSVAFTN